MKKNISSKNPERIKMSKEIQEKEPQRFPCFQEACKQLSMDEIYRLAEASYMLQVKRIGGVIE
ncbi:MAG: hypothetical protein IJF83_05815 [Methanobrevibacter sp.]|nr:hypothetical protein [Methanobrevibacter sp.]